MSVEFRFARADEYPQVSRFLHEYWSPDHIYTRNKSLFDWTFQRRGHWEPGTYSFAVAEEGGEWVGILGGIPFTLNQHGTPQKAVWIVNYVVRPDRRKGPTALQLLSVFRGAPFESTVAFGINPATSAIYRVLRGQVVEAMPRHVMVLPGAQERMKKILSITLPEWSDDRRSSLAGFFELPELTATDMERGSAIPESWDSCEWPTIAAQTVGAQRDSDFLRWRYLEHPCFEHRVITVNDGQRKGLLVWRLETIRQATEDGARQDVDRFGRLLEFMPASEDNAQALFTAFSHDLKDSGAFGADYYGYHGATGCLLNRMGFRFADVHTDGSHIPSRFQPLDGKGGNIMSAMFLKPGTPPCVAGSSCEWYWTKADSDQDRPN